MKTALILHGTPSKEEYYDEASPSPSNHHWIPWLQKQLLKKDIFTQTPEMPEAFAPNYDKWKKEIDRFDIGKETILIGHSCGGGFFVRWLSENKIEVDQAILVAPWLDPDKEKTADFFEFTIDSSIQDRTNNLHILVSRDDDSDIQTSVKALVEAFPEAQLHTFENKGHFTLGGIGSEEFPELLELALS